MGREATRRRYGTKQDVAYLRRQDVARNRGRMSLHAFLHIEKPPPCLPSRCLVVPRRLVIGLHRDGLYLGAGDGTRTRDSLLGRQDVVQQQGELFLFRGWPVSTSMMSSSSAIPV